MDEKGSRAPFTLNRVSRPMAISVRVADANPDA